MRFTVITRVQIPSASMRKGLQALAIRHDGIGIEWPDHKKVKWGKDYSLEALREELHGIVRTTTIRHAYTLPDGQEMIGENVIIRRPDPGVPLFSSTT